MKWPDSIAEFLQKFLTIVPVVISAFILFIFNNTNINKRFDIKKFILEIFKD
jgi:hypothetical protein